MNWVGGARKRVKLQGEKKLQKEFFERKKLEGKPFKKAKRSPVWKPNSVSQDLLALQTVSNIQYSSKDVPKSVRKLDLDQFRSTVCGRRYNEVELPSSPNEKPSMIHLYERGYWSSDEVSGSKQRNSLRSGSLSEPCKSDTGNTQQCTTLPSNQVFYQHKEPKVLGKMPVQWDPFERSFQPVPTSISTKKSCLKPQKSTNYEPRACLHEVGSKTMQQKVHDIKKSKYIAFDQWAVEDFQTTPLVNYETIDRRKSLTNTSSTDCYRSLEDRGYITDQERFHKPEFRHKKYSETGIPHLYEMQELNDMKQLELSLETSDTKIKSESVLDCSNDIYDGYIENRFRCSAPSFSIMNKHQVPERKQSRGIFSPASKLKFSSSKLKEPVSLTHVDRGSTKMKHDKDFSNIWLSNKKPNSSETDNKMFQNRFVSPCSTFAPSNTRVMETVTHPQKYSPKIGLPFPKVNNHLCPEKHVSLTFDHREMNSLIKSAESTISSCSETWSCTQNGEISDLETDSLGLCLPRDMYLINERKLDNGSRLKTSSVDEILKEMKQLENESDDECWKSEKQNQPESVKGDENLMDMTQQNEVVTDDELDEVTQVLQEIVHKVVLLSQHSTENTGFMLPSRSITATSWKATPKKCSQGMKLVNVANMRPLEKTKSVNTNSDFLGTRENGSSTPGWNKLDLVSPITNTVLHQMNKDTNSTKRNQFVCNKTVEILPEEVLTPKSTPQKPRPLLLQSTEAWNPFVTPETPKPICKTPKQEEKKTPRDSSYQSNPDRIITLNETPSKTNVSKLNCGQSVQITPLQKRSFSLPALGKVSDHKSTQTDIIKHDVSTSPVNFSCLLRTADVGTQYDVSLLREVAMEQGDSQEFMDCTMPVDLPNSDTQWTISDSMLESLSQSDSTAGYSLRSRTKNI